MGRSKGLESLYFLCNIENNVIIDRQEEDRKLEFGRGGEDLKQMLERGKEGNDQRYEMGLSRRILIL